MSHAPSAVQAELPAAPHAGPLAGLLMLPGNGFTPAHGFAALSVAHGPALRAACGSLLDLFLGFLLRLRDA